MFAGSRIVTVAIFAALVFGATLCAGASFASSATPPQFRWLVPAPAPSGWKHSSLPSGGAILAYPPSLVPIRGDKTSVSVAKRDASKRILVYLNATPKQGNESLRNWPDFRIAHARSEDDAVHEDARALGLSFLGGKGSCLIDHYATRVHVNHYREIACFVQGHTTASVVVAAALESEWTRVAPLLERAVSAYRVT
jgi:hypothetical protein